MKRILCVILCAVLTVVLLAGCDQSAQQGDTTLEGFSVGYGQADISPEHSVYLTGYGDAKEDRMSTMVLEHLFATCVAFTDDDNNTVIYVSTDLLLAYKEFVEPIRQMISEETGVPFDNVMFHCTHNHSGPDALGDQKYRQLLIERTLQAAKDAMADRKPAQMYTAFTRPEGINFVRHYLLTDGSYMGEAVGTVPKEQLVGHTGKADNLMQLVKFTREGGKDIVMINWQGHPRGTDPNPYTAATCNYPGVMRTTVEEGLDCQAIFVLSGSGNLNNNSQIPEEVLHPNYMELGKALGEVAIEASADFTPANTGKIQLAKSYVTDQGVEGDAGAPLYAFSVGDVAFAVAPFEIFDTNAVAVKENSKFKMTFYSSCTNESRGYLPTPKPFDYYAYEVRVTQYPMGTAENVQKILTSLLDDIFAASGNAEAAKEAGYLTPEFVPATDGVDYINLVPGDITAYREVENGYYQLHLLVSGQTTPKAMLAASKEVAEKVLSQTTMQLIFNECNVIVDVVQ